MKALVAGVVLLCGTAALVLLSFVWLPYDPAVMDIPQRLAPPSWAHVFGTDIYGRDVFSNVVRAGRPSFEVAFFSLAIGAGAGIPMGLLAATARGWPDEILSRFNDVVFACGHVPLDAAGESIRVYYGAADAVLAAADFRVQDILDQLQPC